MSAAPLDEAMLDAELAGRLVAAQFPKWAHLHITPVVPGGWDHRSFRLGNDMVVRLPSSDAYADQVEKESRWLPELAPSLPLAIPEPLELGEPGQGFGRRWAVHRWIEGDTVASAGVTDTAALAATLAGFLDALHRIETRGGPAPGAGNFFRGGPLRTYDGETRQAIGALGREIDARAALRAWEAALATTWPRAPVWVHGDVSAGNLIAHEGRLAAIIDFGLLAIGDPACDLAIAWTCLDAESRSVFRARLALDAGTWKRGRGWALWKASIVAAGMAGTNAVEAAQARRTIGEVLNSDD
jgi:aminoglycoside phosphotransferase (APT) family kinase protein